MSNRTSRRWPAHQPVTSAVAVSAASGRHTARASGPSPGAPKAAASVAERGAAYVRLYVKTASRKSTQRPVAAK